MENELSLSIGAVDQELTKLLTKLVKRKESYQKMKFTRDFLESWGTFKQSLKTRTEKDEVFK